MWQSFTNIRVIILARIRSQESNKLCKPGRGKIITRAILCSFLWSAPVAFRRVALETPEWTSRDSNHHRQSVSAGKTNAIPTEPSGRLRAIQCQKYHRNLSQGATAQLLVMCNRTAVHNQLLQHGFQAAWLGGLRMAATSSAAGTTARIAVVVQTGCGFLSGGRRGASLEDREDCYGRATVALTRAIRHIYIVSPIDMAGMIGMAQTLAVYHYGYHTLKNRQVLYHTPTREPSV